MKKILITFLILLAVCSLSLTLVPSAHSQTSSVKILSYSYYIDSAGYFDVVGEVQNTGTNTLSQVVITGTVFSSDGTAQSNSYAQIGIERMPVNYLAPQQIAPFYMTFFQPTSSSDGTWYSVEIGNINLNVALANATASYQYPDLTITSSTPSIGTNPGTSASDPNTDKGVYWVNGNVENTGDQNAYNVTVMATFYNSTGTVIAVGYSNTVNSLSPSNSATFKLGAFDLNQTNIITSEKIARYTLIVLAQQPILQGTAPITTPYSNTASPAPTSSTSTNPTNNPTSTNSALPDSNSNVSTPQWVYAIVVVVAIIAVAAAFLLLKKRSSTKSAT